MYVSQWINFETSYPAFHKGVSCRVTATRAEGTRFLVSIPTVGTLDVNSSDVKFAFKCDTTTCEEVGLRPFRCADCRHLQSIGYNVDRLSPRGLRYAKATLDVDADMDRVM